MITLGSRLPETENKKICQISDLKRGRGRFRNSSGGRLRESSGNSNLTERQNGCLRSGRLREVVAYGRWSLTGRGR